MKRHPGLQALSRHHHFALIQALEMKRAAETPVARRAVACRSAAEKFVGFWKTVGHLHFREEEEVLLPAYARHAPIEKDAAVTRMLVEHARIRAGVAELELVLQSSAPGESLAAQIGALGRLLHDHVRLEENEIFPRIEKAIPEEDLARLRNLLSELHSKRSCAV
jgi:hemerythrin-like domain-containing protein